MRFAAIILASVLAAPPAALAGSIEIQAYNRKGKPLDTKALLRYIAPAAFEETGVPPEKSGLFLTDMEGRPLPGRPWWDMEADPPHWTWKGDGKVGASLPWPVTGDGFSTVILDGDGKGYSDGQSILLNEEIADTAWRGMKESFEERTANWDPPYKPSKRVRKMYEGAKEAVARAHAADGPRKKAKRFDKALTRISIAWQQILIEHGEQIVRDPDHGRRIRWGLSLDETLIDQVGSYGWIAEKVRESGADWVRLVFRENRGDFTYSEEKSFTLYDEAVAELRKRDIRIMGSVLDSLLWPRDTTPDSYRQRTRNLVRRYRESIRSWEVASEPNGDWLGGRKDPLTRDQVLLAVQKAVVAVKRIDRSLETVATLHWWQGTAPDDEHALFDWLRWSIPRGFGKGIDVVALSVYPHRHPMGIAFDPAFRRLKTFFPEQDLMLGGYSFSDDDRELRGYWWLGPRNVRDARKDLILLYSGAAASIPDGLGGGFFWPTLGTMIKPPKTTTSLYRTYMQALHRVGR